MEPIFENITIETEQLLKEYIRFMHSKRIRLNKVIYAIGAASFLFLGIEWNSWLLIFGAVAYVGLFVRQFFWSASFAKKNLKSKLDYYNQENPPLTYRFLDDHFEVSDIDSWNSTPYDKIDAVTQLKNCLVVNVRNKGGFAISLDGFQKGTPEDLVEYLRTKCPQINPAHWNW